MQRSAAHAQYCILWHTLHSFTHWQVCNCTTLVPPDLPPDLSDWLSRCLEHDPARRATASELLAHAWLLRHAQQAEHPLRRWLQCPVFHLESISTGLESPALRAS